MVQLPDTTAKIATVMDSIRFELPALRAPRRSPIVKAYKDVFGVEHLEAPVIQRIRSGSNLTSRSLYIP